MTSDSDWNLLGFHSFGPQSSPLSVSESNKPYLRVSNNDRMDPSHSFVLPVSHEWVLPGHLRSISSLAIDPSGARMLSGALDRQVMFWAFAGMDAQARAFRNIEPSEGHAVDQLDWSLTGDCFLCGTGHAAVKMFDREGSELGETIRGDMYILDLNKTKGHVAAVTDMCWNPGNYEEYLTGSLDGTLRLWNVNNFKHHWRVCRVKKEKKAKVTACAMSKDGGVMFAGTSQGQLLSYGTKGKLMWADLETQAADKNSSLCSIAVSENGTSVVCRATDHSLSVWDMRKFKTPVKMFQDLHVTYEHADVIFSPDEQIILAGSSSARDSRAESKGELVFIDRTNLDIVERLNVGDGAINRVVWNGKINQIFAGSDNGKIYALYSTELSTKGVLLCVGKSARQKNVQDFTMAVSEAYNPDLYTEDEYTTKGKLWRQDANRRKPELPPKLSNNAAADSALYSTHSFLTHDIIRDTMKDVDPRKALLKYSKAADKDKPVFLQGYAKTQPKPIFDYSEFENATELEAAAAEPNAKKTKLNV